MVGAGRCSDYVQVSNPVCLFVLTTSVCKNRKLRKINKEFANFTVLRERDIDPEDQQTLN